jgi:uncharacterized protein (UPF0147 family)
LVCRKDALFSTEFVFLHNLQMTDAPCILAGMPKNKSKAQGSKAATVGADDDFDKMLAKVTAEDSQVPANVRASTTTTTNVTSRSSSSIRVSTSALANAQS